ncbi:hypothetical protein KIS1582_1434 [Cytobacillus firmus]|uniref:Uncharacterized protein n=1 Tax=Cytobacillus firmus TaxID=1399 RepID=A0A800MY76_CYTFI|nr:hypothetical protein KIS1582_1434 [Cytobacillus firmus]
MKALKKNAHLRTFYHKAKFHTVMYSALFFIIHAQKYLPFVILF